MQSLAPEDLCALDEIPDPGTLVLRREGRSIVLWRRGPSVAAFLNACPHTGARLDTLEPALLDEEGLLVCSVHGARFDAAGLCVSGPCRGRSLTPLPVAVEGDRVRLPG